MNTRNDAAPRFDLTSLGEVMMRLSVGGGRALLKAESFDANLGGAEYNVSAALAALGRTTAWLGSLPDSALGQWAVRTMRADAVDVGGVVLVPDSRLGTYFVELGSPPNPISVVYDRAGSAASTLGPDEIDWDLLLDSRWLHLTGITPALGKAPAEAVDQALRLAAEEDRPKVSLDVNYRTKLWSPDAARAWLEPRLELADLIICGISDAATVFGLRDEPEAVARSLAERSRGRQAVVTVGSKGAVAWQDGEFVRADGVSAQVIDRLGAGDAFAAGVIDGVLDGSLEGGLRRGVTLAAAALGQRGDTLSLSRSTLERLVAGAGTRPDR